MKRTPKELAKVRRNREFRKILAGEESYMRFMIYLTLPGQWHSVNSQKKGVNRNAVRVALMNDYEIKNDPHSKRRQLH